MFNQANVVAQTNQPTTHNQPIETPSQDDHCDAHPTELLMEFICSIIPGYPELDHEIVRSLPGFIRTQLTTVSKHFKNVVSNITAGSPKVDNFIWFLAAIIAGPSGVGTATRYITQYQDDVNRYITPRTLNRAIGLVGAEWSADQDHPKRAIDVAAIVGNEDVLALLLPFVRDTDCLPLADYATMPKVVASPHFPRDSQLRYIADAVKSGDHAFLGKMYEVNPQLMYAADLQLADSSPADHQYRQDALEVYIRIGNSFMVDRALDLKYLRPTYVIDRYRINCWNNLATAVAEKYPSW